MCFGRKSGLYIINPTFIKTPASTSGGEKIGKTAKNRVEEWRGETDMVGSTSRSAGSIPANGESERWFSAMDGVFVNGFFVSERNGTKTEQC